MFRIRDGLVLGTTVVIDANGNLTTTANTALTAGRLVSSRTLSLTGAITGSVSTDFSGTTTLATVLSNTAVTPGTYRSVTVTQDGRIVSGTNPTTLSGYGITDAQPLDSTLSNLALLTGIGLVFANNTNDFVMKSVGVATSASILDRASGDARYAPLSHTQAISTITGLQTALDAKSDVGHQHVIADTSGLQTALDGKLSLSGGVMTGVITLSAAPSSPMDAATKQYVDDAAQGLSVKASVRVATLANITLSGTQTIDGVAVVAGDRVLVKNQTTASQNGIYVVAAGAWVRSTDVDTWSELLNAFTFVESGAANANTGWTSQSGRPGGTLGTTDVSWIQFSGSASFTASNGVAKAGIDFQLTGQALQLHNLTGGGFISRASGGGVAARVISTTSTAGLVVTNGNGATGNPSIDLNAKLEGLAGLSGTAGIVVQTGTNTFDKRSLAAGTGILISNADGSSNPSISVNANLQSLNAVTWTSGVIAPVMSGANSWSSLDVLGTGGLMSPSYGDARYVGLAGSTMTGTLVLAAGTTTVQPLRFQAGALLTTPVSHSLEWNGNNLFLTNASNTRKQVAFTDSDISGAAAKWSTARSVTLTGDVTGSFSIDGSANVGGVALTISPLAVTSGMLASGVAVSNLGYTPASRAGDTFTGQVAFAAGSSTVAPVRFQAGSIRTTPAAHSMEWNGTNLYMTNSTNVRQTIQYASDALAWSRVTGTPTTLSGYGITDALSSSAYTAADVLAKLLTVDGAASNLDADFLDGHDGTFYQNATNLNTGTLNDSLLSSNVVLKDANNTLTGTTSLGSTHRQSINLFSTTMGLGTQANTQYARTSGRFSIFKGGVHDPLENTPGSGGTVLFTVSDTDITYRGNSVVHTGAMGAGSLVDADLLDGQQGSFYQSSTNQISGTLPAARLPAFTGDVVSSIGTSTLALASVNGNVGSFGSATQVATFTVNAKGLTTAAGNVTITPAWGSITGKPTTLSGYGITDAQGLDATLTSLAALTGAGVVTATGTDAFTMRSIGAASATDILDRTAADARYLQPSAANSTNDARFVQLSGSTMTGPLVLSGDPTLALHPATKQYVDNAIQGLDAKASVRVATTANITLSAPQTIDTISVVAGDRVLVKNQTTASQNGVYVVAAGAWLRAQDFNGWEEVVKSFVFVEEGSANGNSGWVNTNATGGTLDGTGITFVQFSGAGTYTASQGITRSGSDFQLTGQALAFHGISTNGLIARTASGTVASRAVTAPAAGITVTNGDGVAGNPTLVLANDLAAVEGLSTTGFVRRTGTDTWAATALTSSEITTALGFTPFHTGNDGTGSLLDADLLDGQHGAFYLDLTNATGTLSTARGGTGMASFVANTYVRATSTSTLDNRTFDQVRADIMAARTVESTTPPSTPSIGDGWIDSNSGTKYNYISGYWVEL